MVATGAMVQEHDAPYAVKPPALPADYYVAGPHERIGGRETQVVNPAWKYLTGGTLSDQTLEAGPSTLPNLQLVGQSPADDRWSTPYYAAKTNMGDTAVTVAAQEGAKVRLIDPANGQVVAEGVGPQGSQYIASLAGQLSAKLGKQANWDVAVETAPGSGQFYAGGGDRTDKPRFTLLSALKQYGPAILGTIVAGPMGFGALAGAAAAGGSSLLAGNSLKSSLLSAAGVGAGSALGSALGGAGSAAGGAGSGLSGTAGALGSSAADFLPGELAGAVAPLTVTAGGSALGAGLGALGGGALGSALSSSGGSSSLAGSSGSDTLGSTPVASGGDVVVMAQQAARQGLSLSQMVALGIPAAAAAAALAGVVGGGASGPVTAADPTTSGVQPATPPDTTGLTPTPSPSVGPTSALDKALAAAKDNPMLTARLLALGAAAVGGSGNSGNGAYSTNSLAGTRASLDPVFSMSLPPPTFGVRTPQAVDTDWSTYATRPEQTFFKRPQHLAEGGAPYAVRGEGSGRSDSIDAKLSDGEYVMDAETVSMLGDGSSAAGAKKLDQFRVNLRKHKGRELAKGRFSVDAHPPETYLKGGRG